MFNPGFYNNNGNVVPNQNTSPNQYQEQYPVYNSQVSYAQGFYPSMAAGNTQAVYYPPDPSAVPYQNAPQTYAEGGRVQKKEKYNPYPPLAEMIRQQGKGEDMILAHINPLEAELLKGIGGSGTINPKTGLPQFGFFKNPKKWFKSVVGPAVGTILGNMIMPGLGGVVGGALGGAAGSKVRGRKDGLQAALRGAAIGGLAPTISSGLGSGLKAMGSNDFAGMLTNYGNQNAILPSLDKLIGGSSLSSLGGSIGKVAPKAIANRGISGVSAGDEAEGGGFVDKLIGKSSDFFSSPANLLTTAIVGTSLLNRPKAEKPKSPEQLADEQKRFMSRSRLTPQEMAEKEAYDLAEEQMRRRVARNKFLPDERLGPISPVYRKSHAPEEYARTGRWLSYYDNPQFTGAPIPYKEGGAVHPEINYQIEEIRYPTGMGIFLQGTGGGQSDNVPAMLSDGEYVIDASTVANLGDGNNTAGAKKLDQMVKNIRMHKGGSAKLPPKAKSISQYLRG
jgi:hypothetical protein